MLFYIQLISDLGYQDEIARVTSACHQIEVFSRVLKTSINSFLEDGEEFMQKSLEKFTVSCCGLIYFWFPASPYLPTFPRYHSCLQFVNYFKKNIYEILLFQKMVSHGHHTFLYTQCLLHLLSQNTEGVVGPKRLGQEVYRRAQKV